MIIQADAAECGLACLAMICGFYGRNVGLAELRPASSSATLGMSARDIVEVAATQGMIGRALRLEVSEAKGLTLPCIVHWSLDHFVVLTSIGRKGWTIHDPALGARLISAAEVDRNFTGIAIELSTAPSFRTAKKSRALKLSHLFGSTPWLMPTLLRVVAISSLIELCALAAPQFLQLVLDRSVSASDEGLLAVLALGFCIVAALQPIFVAVRSSVLVWATTSLATSWQPSLFWHLLRLPQRYFAQRRLGDTLSRLGSMNSIHQTVAAPLAAGVMDGLMAGVVGVFLVIYSRPMAVLTVASAALYGLVRFLYLGSLQRANTSQIAAEARKQTIAIEGVRGVQTLKCHNTVEAQAARYLDASVESGAASARIQGIGITYTCVTGILIGLSRIAMVWYGGKLVLAGSLTGGMLIAYAAYAELFVARISAFIEYLVQLRVVGVHLDRLDDIASSAPEAGLGMAAHLQSELASEVEFDRVSFRHAEGQPWILQDFSMRIAPGEIVAITGPSGAGKTTIARLLLGLIEPNQGTIRVGGVDIRDLGKRRLRESVASVLQNDALFSGSILENIAFFDENVKLVAVEAAARHAAVHDDIVALPMGYRTPVGDMGSMLSSGQMQRILLARAIYRDAPILVLDEATSHVDARKENDISIALSRLGRTALVIAHRQETIRKADRVLELRGGACHGALPEVEPDFRWVRCIETV